MFFNTFTRSNAMRLQKIKIAALLLLCFTQTVGLFAQDFPPPPAPPPPGLPIDDYVPFMILIALIIGVFYFIKFNGLTKVSKN